MSVYVNGIEINLNEVSFINFIEKSSETNSVSVAKVAMLYSTLKQFHEVIGQAIEQHDKKLGELQRTKENMN